VDLKPWLGERRRRLDWVIVGGETGPGARPMHPWWPRSICNQALAAGAPFFFKQWGEWLPENQFGADGDRPTPANTGCWQHGKRALAVWPDGRSSGSLEEDGGVVCYRVGRRNAGRLLDGRTWDESPVE
jgi:protein gp37